MEKSTLPRRMPMVDLYDTHGDDSIVFEAFWLKNMIDDGLLGAVMCDVDFGFLVVYRVP